MAKFLKLGKAAQGGSFSDGSVDLSIAGNQITKAEDHHLVSSYLQERMQSGHVVETTEAEFNKWTAEENARQNESLKKGKKQKLAAPVKELEEDLDDDDDDDDDSDDHDEDTAEKVKTKETMIADLMASQLIDGNEKAGLKKLSVEKLVKLHNKIIAGQ